MPSLKEVRNRIKSVNSTQQITKAMKMVAAAKLRKAQDAIMQLRPYSRKLDEILGNLATNPEVIAGHPFARHREVNQVIIVAITSDRGLCGPFNANIFKEVSRLIQEKYTEQSANGNVRILTIGRKSNEFFTKRGYPVIGDFSAMLSNLKFDSVRLAAEYCMSEFLNGKADVVEIVYNEFKNVATQIIRRERFLPLTSVQTVDGAVSNDYIFEPSRDSIVSELIPKSLKIKFYKSLLESNASENGARMTAMDKATDNAGELLKSLKLEYNRSRQASITKEILEIVGGAEALKSGA